MRMKRYLAEKGYIYCHQCMGALGRGHMMDERTHRQDLGDVQTILVLEMDRHREGIW